jgi:hypothetical protein
VSGQAEVPLNRSTAADLRDLEQILLAAHRRLDQRDIARGITRYPTPFNLEDNNGKQPSNR